MKLADTHAHLYWDKFEEDFDEVIQRAVNIGLTYIINIGVNLDSSKKALNQIKNTEWPRGLTVYSTIGIHPEEISHYSSSPDESIHKDIEKLEEIYHLAPNHIVAIGECGLDFMFANNPWGNATSLSPNQIRELQIKLFQAQIDLAKKLNLPLLIHCRDDRSINPENSEAWEEVIEMTKDHFGIYHCYSGLPQTTNHLLQATNFLVSFAGNLTYPQNDYLRKAVKLIPIERIVLETDCPFLPPQSRRGQRNEPCNVLEIAKVVAEIKGILLEEVGEQTTKNVSHLLSNREANTLI